MPPRSTTVRSRRLHRIVRLASALAVAASVVGPARPAQAAVDPGAAEARFLQLLNMERAGAGMNLLVLDGAASNVARGWSGAMATAGAISHNPSLASAVTSQVTPDWTRIGENVGVGGDVDGLNLAFWNSAPHRSNILGDFNRVGVGVVVSGSTVWVTFDFVKGPAISGTVGVAGCTTPGYLLDGWGAVHPVGGAPALAASAYWVGWDIARDLSFASGSHAGYVLDGWGGLHPTAGAAPLADSAYWPGWDIARAVAVTADGRGAYVLDGWGALHPAGSAPSVTATAYWAGWDIARDVRLDPTDADRGYVLEGFGGLHPFGGMPPARESWYVPGDNARTFVFLTDGTGGYVTDAYGGMHPFAVGDAPMPPALPATVPLATPAVRGTLPGGAGAVVTGGGAVLGLGGSCGSAAPWGNWAIVRAAVDA